MPSVPTPSSATTVPQTFSYTVEEYLHLPRAAETWLTHPIIPVGGAVNIYGDSKVGKSFAALQLACALTGATPNWLGFRCPTHGPVLYVQLDTPRSLWTARLDEVIAAGYSMRGIHLADCESLDAWPFRIEHPAHFARLRGEIDRIQPIAVIIDTLREAHGADENDATESQAAVSRIVACTRPAAMILVSHSRKAKMEGGPDLINDQRGSNYLPGKMDAIIRFTRKHVIYVGRACEEGSIKLKRLDCGFWEPEHSEVDAHVEAVVSDVTYTTMSARAKALSTRIGRGEEACRSLLRRYHGGTTQRTNEARPSL